MSNDVYGYILLNTKLDYKSTFNNYIKSSSLNIRDINKS